MRQRTRLHDFTDRLLRIPKELGPRLTRYQEMSGLTDLELARAASIRVEYLEHIKKGTLEPSKAKLAALAKALEVTVGELVE